MKVETANNTLEPGYNNTQDQNNTEPTGPGNSTQSVNSTNSNSTTTEVYEISMVAYSKAK